MDKRNEIHYIRSSVYLRTFWEYRFYSSKFFCIILMKKIAHYTSRLKKCAILFSLKR